MSKLLPYFKWYPGDAETDDFYALTLSNEELGIYHRLLNRSWMNDGISSDMDSLAALCRMSRKQFDKAWEKVGKRWIVSPRDINKLVNQRQEVERVSAQTKSENNKREGNANAKGSRPKREPNGPPRALAGAESVYVVPSDVVVSSKNKVVPISSVMFLQFWERYPRKFGEDAACRDWCSEVTTENELEVFACLDRYLASEEVRHGAVMYAGSTMKDTGWIVKCARDKWKSDWPRAREPTLRGASVQDKVKALAMERIARDGHL